MSSAEPSEVPSPAPESGRLLQKASEVGDTDETTSAGAQPSKYSGLRDLQKQKEKWPNLLRWVLILSFLIQAALLVALLFGRPLDDWTIRAVLLQFTAMFIASLRFLFR